MDDQAVESHLEALRLHDAEKRQRRIRGLRAAGSGLARYALWGTIAALSLVLVLALAALTLGIRFYY